MPDVALNLVRSGSVTGLGDITSNFLRKSLREDQKRQQLWMHGFWNSITHVVLQEPNRLGHETGTDQEEETSRNDQEPVQGKGRTGSVN